MPLDIPLVEEKEIAKEKKVPTIPKRLGIELVEEEEVIPARIGREPTGVKPVIPTKDGCCIDVCTYLNKEIDIISQAINIRQEDLKILGRGEARMRARRQVTALTNKISALKDVRFIFKEKGVCRCIEDV